MGYTKLDYTSGAHDNTCQGPCTAPLHPGTHTFALVRHGCRRADSSNPRVPPTVRCPLHAWSSRCHEAAMHHRLLVLVRVKRRATHRCTQTEAANARTNRERKRERERETHAGTCKETIITKAFARCCLRIISMRATKVAEAASIRGHDARLDLCLCNSGMIQQHPCLRPGSFPARRSALQARGGSCRTWETANAADKFVR